MWLSVHCWEKTRRYEGGENGSDGRTRRRNNQPGTSCLSASHLQHFQGTRSAGGLFLGEVQSAGEKKKKKTPQSGSERAKKAQEKCRGRAATAVRDGSSKHTTLTHNRPSRTSGACCSAPLTLAWFEPGDSSWNCSWTHVGPEASMCTPCSSERQPQTRPSSTTTGWRCVDGCRYRFSAGLRAPTLNPKVTSK